MRDFLSTTLLITTILMISCAAPTPSDLPQSTTVTPTAIADTAVKIVVLGDSIAAGLGLPESDAFPAVVAELLRDAGYEVRIVNAGVSGDTSAGGLRRIDWILQQQPDVVIIELGANDGLRGQPLDSTESNLREIVRRSSATGARVVLLGMDVPTSYGPDYAGGFAALFERIASDEQVTFVPGFLREVATDPQLMQPDGLHPTADGQRALAQSLVPALTPLIESISAGNDINGEAEPDLVTQ